MFKPKQIPWNKGKKNKISETLKRKNASGEIKKLVGKDNPNYGQSPWNKGKTGVYSEETRKKIGDAQRGGHKNLGIKKSEAHKKKLSEALVGNIPWSKGLHIWEDRPHPKGMLGKKQSLETKAKLSQANKGKVVSLETRLKMSASQKGEKNRQWKGGMYRISEQVRDCFEYRQWRSDVFLRDNFTCQKCLQYGGKLHAHHLKLLSKILEDNQVTNFEQAQNCSELWNINNGQTVCEDCHKNIHKLLKVI
jgi:hypothetical protein